MKHYTKTDFKQPLADLDIAHAGGWSLCDFRAYSLHRVFTA